MNIEAINNIKKHSKNVKLNLMYSINIKRQKQATDFDQLFMLLKRKKKCRYVYTILFLFCIFLCLFVSTV